MRVALVQDWLTEMGGAEKVFISLLKAFPHADVFTLTSHKNVIEKLPITGRLYESFISRLPFGRIKYRNYLQLFPKAIESFDLSSYDIIISSSYSVAKGVLTNSNQLHICYCHSPVRYAWDLYHQYMNETGLNDFWSIKGMYARHVLHKIRIWDESCANRVDYFIANSQYIKRRIFKVYRRGADVIYPPVDVSKFPMEQKKAEYYFTASRMVPYKKIDLIVRSFNQMPDKTLIVAGTGPDMKKIRAIAGPNIQLKGFVADEEMVLLMSKAKAFVFAADEDFGIAPVEAQACGTPVICYGKGGTRETVVDGKTGIHFEEQTENAIIAAIDAFENGGQFNFDTYEIRKNAERFSSERFVDEIFKFVNLKMQEFNTDFE
ncbi:MAG: glycosyltransferase [Breznakibacter sp.]